MASIIQRAVHWLGSHGVAIHLGFVPLIAGERKDTIIAGGAFPTFTWGTANPPTQAEANGSIYWYRSASAKADVFWHREAGAWVRIGGSIAWHHGTISAPAADSADGVHANNGDDVQVWPGPITSPVVPRNISITFDSAWAGGNVTVTGTNQFEAAQTETIVANPGNKVEGVKAFKTVTGIAHAAVGPGGLNHGATAGWGHKFGVAKTLLLALGVLTEDGNNDAAAWDDTYCAFTPTQLPNGSLSYHWAVPT
jgi:hypothetical protein